LPENHPDADSAIDPRNARLAERLRELECVVGKLRETLGITGERCAECALRRDCPRNTVALSPREKDVAVHIARGLATKQIAAALGIGIRTVNTYRESLARKLGSSSPAVVTRFVLEAGLDG
jgi:DNA-binding CsgD family transcriptional regulator